MNGQHKDLETFIDPANNVFQYEGYRFLTYFHCYDADDGNWDMWILLDDLLDYFACAIDFHSEGNMFTFAELSKPKTHRHISKDAIFLNMDGFVEFLLRMDNMDSLHMAKYFNVYEMFAHDESDIVYHLSRFCQIADIRYETRHLIKSNGQEYIVDFYIYEPMIVIMINRYVEYDDFPEFLVIQCNTYKWDFRMAELIAHICNISCNYVEKKQPAFYQLMESKKVQVIGSDISFHDFIRNVLPIQTIETYLEQATESMFFVKPEYCIKILRKEYGKTDNLFEVIESKCSGFFLDPDNNVFQFGGHRFLVYFHHDREVNWDMWISLKELLDYYSYAGKSICKYISKENMITYSKLLKLLNKSKTNRMIRNNTIFLNINGFVEFLLHTGKPDALDMIKYFDVTDRYIRKETEIVYHLNKFCEQIGLRYEYQHIVVCHGGKYIVDYYIYDIKIVLEIDEHNHYNRDPKYEKKRQEDIRYKLGCTFIRCDPHAWNFSVIDLFAHIYTFITI